MINQIINDYQVQW